MKLEPELRKKSFTPSKFEQATDASAFKPITFIDVEDAIAISKKYTKDMCGSLCSKLISALVLHSLHGNIEMVKINCEQIERELNNITKLHLLTMEAK